MNPNDLELIKNYALAGAGLGAGGVGLTALVNHLLNVRREASGPSQKDILKLTLKQPAREEGGARKQASGPSFLRGPAAIMALLGSATAAGLGTHALYQAYKRKKLQDELEQAQHGYLNVLDPSQRQEGEKQASAGKGMSAIEALSSLPLTAGVLTALASAAVANAALRKTFPDAKPGTRLGPKRVVINYANSDKPPITVPLDKSASSFLIDVVADAGASDSPTRDLVYAVAQGRLPELRKVASEEGVSMIFDVTHGASNNPVSLARVKLASHVLADDGYLGPIALFMAASEFADQAPNWIKLAAFMSDEDEQVMIKSASIEQAAFFEHTVVPLLDTTGDTVERLAGRMPVKDAAASMLERSWLPAQLIPGLGTAA